MESRASDLNSSYKRVRLFTNWEIKVESYMVPSGFFDIMNSGHWVYDIGLKRESRDSGTNAYAYFGDLMIFDREYSFPPNVKEIKDDIFAKHPLHNIIYFFFFFFQFDVFNRAVRSFKGCSL